MARISRFLDLKSRTIIYNSFVMSNFTYCPLTWHFCGKQNNYKIEKIQERALRILYQDTLCSYQELIQRADTTTVILSRLRTMALEVFKCTKSLNPPCLNSLFEIKSTGYSLRNSVKLDQPLRRKTTHGLCSFSYLGSNIWNDLANSHNDICDVTVYDFKRFLKTWD